MPRNELDAILSADRMNESIPASEVCEIIKCASECGVSQVKLGSLEISFFDRTKKETIIYPDLPLGDLASQEKDTKRTLLEESARIREEELATLSLTDPQRYEELLLQGELEGGTENESQD
jgi:hypothetical protein